MKLQNPFLITFRTIFSVRVSGLNIYESVVFSYCFATPFLFKKYKCENLSFHSLSINSLSSYNWPWALLESSFLYWVEMFSYISTHSSIPCGHTEQILFHTTAIQVFEDGYVHTLHHLCSRQFFMSHDLISLPPCLLGIIPVSLCTWTLRKTLALVWTTQNKVGPRLALFLSMYFQQHHLPPCHT